MQGPAVDLILAAIGIAVGLLVAANDLFCYLHNTPTKVFELPCPPMSFLVGVAGTAVFLQLDMTFSAGVYGALGFYGIIRRRFVHQGQGYN